MQDKKFIIAFLGYACTGKSTVARALADRASDIYLVSTDKQKWLLSGYDRNTHPVPIKEITFGLFEAVCKTGLSIQLEYIRTEEDYLAAKEMADKYGYELRCFEFTAPRDVLLERFHERVEEAKKTGMQISVTREEVFLGILDKGYYAPAGIPVFDTTKLSTEEIVEGVLSEMGPDFVHTEQRQSGAAMKI